MPVVVVAWLTLSGCSGDAGAPSAAPVAAPVTVAAPSGEIVAAGATPSSGLIPKARRGSSAPTPTVKASTARVRGTVTYPDGVKLKVVSVTRGVEKGQGPGAFPGRTFVVLGLELVNGSKTSINLDRVVVTALAGKPAAVVPQTYAATADVRDFAGTVKPGASARAAYAFAMDPGPQDTVRVVVDFDGAHTSATFTGPLGS